MNYIKQPKVKFGQVLFTQRREKKLSLENISKNSGIPFKYLEALECGDFNNLPKRKWPKILEKYCNFLDLNFRDVYRVAKQENKKNSVKDLLEKNYLRSWPKTIKRVVIFVIIVAVLIFLGFKINQIFSAPPLEILEPQDSSQTFDKQLMIKGKSQKEVEIYINNNVIFVDKEGNFETTMDLQAGLNLIKITAKKKYSRIREVNLRVLLAEQDIPS